MNAFDIHLLGVTYTMIIHQYLITPRCLRDICKDISVRIHPQVKMYLVLVSHQADRSSSCGR